MKEIPRISESEWKVMEAVWQDPPMKARQVVERLSGLESWKPQTVKTLLGRLVKKGALRSEAVSNHFLYHPEISREQAVAGETRSFLERICQGSLTPMLAHLVDSRRPLHEDELQALSALLRKESVDRKDDVVSGTEGESVSKKKGGRV